MIRFVTLVSLLSLVPVVAGSQSWTEWERENAVAQFRSFLVIRQPGEAFCYVKQSYAGDPGKMELIFDGDAVTVVTPHIASARWDVTYWIDSGERQTIPHEAIMSPNSFLLPDDMLQKLEAGNYLNVRVVPVGEAPVAQTISLLGFTAASRKLVDAECQGATAREVADGAADEASPVDADESATTD